MGSPVGQACVTPSIRRFLVRPGGPDHKGRERCRGLCKSRYAALIVTNACVFGALLHSNTTDVIGTIMATML